MTATLRSTPKCLNHNNFCQDRRVGWAIIAAQRRAARAHNGGRRDDGLKIHWTKPGERARRILGLKRIDDFV
jgi:hypothetical protein